MSPRHSGHGFCYTRKCQLSESFAMSAVPSRIVIDLSAAEQVRLRKQLRTARWGWLAHPTYPVAARPAALSPRICPLAFLFAFLCVCRRVRLAVGPSALGNRTGRGEPAAARRSHSDPAMQPVGAAEQSAVSLWL